MRPGQGLFLGRCGLWVTPEAQGEVAAASEYPPVRLSALAVACGGSARAALGTSQAFCMCSKIAQSNLAGAAAGTRLTTQSRVEVGTGAVS